jgi:hypothetical protein
MFPELDPPIPEPENEFPLQHPIQFSASYPVNLNIPQVRIKPDTHKKGQEEKVGCNIHIQIPKFEFLSPIENDISMGASQEICTTPLAQISCSC